MKKCVFIILLFCACEEDKIDPHGNGCLTGIPKGETERVLIRCCTEDQYFGGSNPAAGGTADWNNYTAHQWEPISDCNDCK